MVLLCSHHHHLVHEGGFSIGREAGGRLVTRAPAGWEIDNEPAPRRAAARELVAAQGELAILADTLTPDWHGDRLDLEYVVWTLLHQRRTPTSVGDPYGNNGRGAGEVTAWGADRPTDAAEPDASAGQAREGEAREGEATEDDAAA
jgi:hypothetical protein